MGKAVPLLTIVFAALFSCAAKAETSETEAALFNQNKAKAESGDRDAELVLGMHYAAGDGVRADAKMAFKWWKSAAEKGSSPAQWRTGLCLAEGRGVARDVIDAEKWLLKSAEQKNDQGQLALGIFYYATPEKADLTKAIFWLEKSQAGEWGAKASGVDDYLLGLCHETEKRMGKATEHFTIAASKGHPGAMVQLGLLYLSGETVPKDYARALNSFRAASSVTPTSSEWKSIPSTETEVGEAYLNLGICYAKGLGVTKNYQEAARCFQEAAALNDPNALWALGIYHEFGRGVPLDPIKAYAYYNLAGTRLPKASADLAKLESRMTSAEVAAGQARTHDLLRELEIMKRTVGRPRPGR